MIIFIHIFFTFRNLETYVAETFPKVIFAFFLCFVLQIVFRMKI
jgi:hypothetical protein